MIKRTLLIVSTVIINSVYGINLQDLKNNGIRYYFDAQNGKVKRINFLVDGIEDDLFFDQIPLFLENFYWNERTDYIFCEDKQVDTNLSSPVIESLSEFGNKCIYITLQHEGETLHTITCIFPKWPGLANVSETAAYDNNRGIMLFPLIPLKPQWLGCVKNINDHKDFWKNLNSNIVSEGYDKKVLNAGVSGRLCIALPCLVNYYKGVLSFFCPMRDTAFSLNLASNKVCFSNRLETNSMGHTLIMDEWSLQKTQVIGVEVQTFESSEDSE